MSETISGRATVLAATVCSGKWYQSGTNRYDFVLEVRPDRGQPTFRTEVANVRIYQAQPPVGTDVAVEIDAASREVRILWRGDPNLDMDAWRSARKQHDEQQRRDLLRGPDSSPPG
jgi:hypothetical protein